jgi:hypothetical protein
MSENSSALNGIAPSAVRLTKALWLLEKQMFPALTRRSSTSEYLRCKPSLILIMIHIVLSTYMVRKMAICTYRKTYVLFKSN